MLCLFFYRSASLPVYEKLWKFIEKHGTLEPNATYAIEKVRKTENYAFIWDSAVLEYEVQREPCNTLTLIERFVSNLNTFNIGLIHSNHKFPENEVFFMGCVFWSWIILSVSVLGVQCLSSC